MYLVSVPVIFTYNYINKYSHFGSKHPQKFERTFCVSFYYDLQNEVSHINLKFSLHLPPTTPIWEWGPKHRTMRKKYFSVPSNNMCQSAFDNIYLFKS